MVVAIVTIICVAMIVVGGITLSQGILTTADTSAVSVESISVREGEIMRTALDVTRAEQLTWSDYFRATVKNTGQTKLASYDKWDVILSYVEGGGNMYSRWLPYSASPPGNNQWQKARLGLKGPLEFFEPGILNPDEEMVILAKLDPSMSSNATGDITFTTPNGVYNSRSFIAPGYTRLTPQSENVNIAGTLYYDMAESAADGTAMHALAQFAESETGRKLLYNADQVTRPAMYLFPLVGIEDIPAGTWTVRYRAYVLGEGTFPADDNDVRFNIDILVRQADGTVRDVIDVGVADAYYEAAESGNWITITGEYNFTGYHVADENDYLEIDYYGQTALGPSGGPGYTQLSIDDDGLPAADQTGIVS
jgi:hypothetical protein